MRMVHGLLLWLIACSISQSVLAATDVEATVSQSSQAPSIMTLQSLIDTLPTASYDEKSILIRSIAEKSTDDSLAILTALLQGDLFYIKKTQQLVYRAPTEGKQYRAIAALTGEILGEYKNRKLKKVGINNKLRGELKNAIALVQLKSPDSRVRQHAVDALMGSLQPEYLPLIHQALLVEKDNQIREPLMVAKAVLDLSSKETELYRSAINTLHGSLYPAARIALIKFIEAPHHHSSSVLIDQAKQAIASIDQKVKLNNIAENVYFGIALGAVLLLAAIGLAITFGVMGVINMAHGEMIMLGAYTTFVVQQCMPNHLNYSLLVAIPAAFLVSGLVGVLIERSVIRHLYGRTLETLLATFGISLILQQAVRSIFGPLNQDVNTPDWMAGTFSVNPGLALTYNRLYIILFSLLLLAALALVLKKTLFGLQMRAVTLNRPMASSMGIKTGWVDALTFGLGSGIAGIAGVALSQLTNVGPNLGQAYIIDSFMVVVFGGVGNLWGTLVGAMSLGIANKVFEPLAGAVLAKIIVLVAIILFIQKRPRGLFALKGRAVEG